MPDSPDSEPVFDTLKRFLRALLTTSLVLILVLAVFVVAIYVFNPLMFHAIADSPHNVFANEPRVFESTTIAAGCAPNATGNATVAGYQFLGARYLRITGNVTLPDASSVLTEPTIVKRTEHEYALVVEGRPTNETKRGCQGLVRYTAKIRLPYGTNNYTLVVRHGKNQTLRIV